MLSGPHGALDRPLLRLPFTSLAVLTVLLPLTGLLACLFLSLVYHYEDATYTHCHVSPRPNDCLPASFPIHFSLTSEEKSQGQGKVAGEFLRDSDKTNGAVGPPLLC